MSSYPLHGQVTRILLFECFNTWSMSQSRGLLYLDCDHKHVANFLNEMTASPTNRRSTTVYCVFVGRNIVNRRARNKLWFLNLIHNLNIKSWQMLHVSWFRYEQCWKKLASWLKKLVCSFIIAKPFLYAMLHFKIARNNIVVRYFKAVSYTHLTLPTIYSV